VRILIVFPASIIEQWQTKLASKFGFQFKILPSSAEFVGDFLSEVPPSRTAGKEAD